MKQTTQKLEQLEAELKQIVKDAEAGKINKAEAADKILHLRESIDLLLKTMKEGK